MTFTWKQKATNAILIDENTGGKGKKFQSRFLEAGLVKYSFGVCVLDNETIHKFIDGFVGCPVIIDHKDVTNENAKDERVGVISRVWYNELDGWFWGEGIIFDEKALSLIEDGYNVSCQYEITEYANNTEGKLHNGNPYDKVILNGKPEHLAIVKNPRYENALIAINALDLTESNEKSDENEQKTCLDNIKQAINDIKETEMFGKLFKKKEKQMDKDELKSLFMECLSELTAKNEADEEKKEDDKLADDKVAENEDKKEDDKKAENEDDEDDKKEDAENKCKNEVDKRDIIRQIMAIAGKEEASEDVKTIAKLAEKLAYDKSEAGTADNKCKNEEEDKKEDKEDEEKKEKASNAIDELMGKMTFGSERVERSTYMTQKKAVELGDKLF